MKEKRKNLEKVGFGICFMFLISWIWSIFIRSKLNFPSIYNTIIGIIILYGIGLTIFKLFIKDIPKSKIVKNKITFKTIIICFLLQFTSIFIMSMITIVLSRVTNNEIGNNLNTLTPMMLFQLLIFNPVIEEYVFRKLFANKLLKYGELFYMLVSSFCFAIVHGVSLGIPQIIYTFILGMIWSYLVVKTGNIKLSIILHSLSNLFGSVVIQLLQGISMEIAGIYSMFIILLGIIGLVCFIKSKKNIVLDNQNKLLDKKVLKDMFTNKGIICYVVITIIMMILKGVV